LELFFFERCLLVYGQVEVQLCHLSGFLINKTIHFVRRSILYLLAEIVGWLRAFSAPLFNGPSPKFFKGKLLNQSQQAYYFGKEIEYATPNEMDGFVDEKAREMAELDLNLPVHQQTTLKKEQFQRGY
jgi:hypothetical protein